MHGFAVRRCSRVGLLALALMASACGDADRVAPVAAVDAVLAVPAPVGLSAGIDAGAARAQWSAPPDMPEPLTGYDFYVDGAAPVRLPPNVTSRAVPGRLVAGDEHLVQVVALTATGRSRPVGATIKVPYPDQADVDAAVEAPVTDRPGSAPAAVQPPAPSARVAPADAAPPANAAPPARAGSSSGVATPAGVLEVKGVLHWLTFGTSTCEGWRKVDDLVHVLDNAGSILAVASIVTKTTQPQHDPESARCEYHYSAVVPAGGSPVYTFHVNVDEKRLHSIVRRNRVTVSAASVSGGKGPDLVVSDA